MVPVIVITVPAHRISTSPMNAVVSVNVVCALEMVFPRRTLDRSFSNKSVPFFPKSDSAWSVFSVSSPLMDSMTCALKRELSFIKSSEEIVSIFTKKIEQKINEVWGE